MKRRSILVKLIWTLLLVVVALSSCVVHAEHQEEEEEETCSLNPSTNTGDCTTAETSAATSPTYSDILSSTDDLTRLVIPLNDETFDAFTWTSQPSTWLVMFKTDACGLCKKAKPVLESLSVDDDIINHHDEQMKRTNIGEIAAAATEEIENDEDQPPKGPIYIATIDAGSWAGRDITKRFKVDGTPHMILIRNEGYEGERKEESRSYYVYRGQRALYPLRKFVLGEFMSRKQIEFPPPLTEDEQKKSGIAGRLYDLLLLPSVKWAGNIVKKIFIAWIVFIGLIGLFMRVHNYAWGENADDDYNEEEEIEKEKAKGRAEFEEDKDERAKRRQQIMWERKRANHEKRMQKKDGGDGDEDFQGSGSSVKKSDILKAKASTKQKGR
mmetsp:Transcript_686/g.898  ORF Transcript_686/g.898 Transcript_686/m.898 type:complete len:383 (-) Transcript_686:113-1261(-)